MLDIKQIRADKDAIEKKLRTKDSTVDLSLILKLDEEIRKSKTKVEQLKAKRNTHSKQIGSLKKAGKYEEAEKIKTEVAQFAEEIHTLDHFIQTSEKEFFKELACCPNLPMEDVKVSDDISDNVILKEIGEKKEFTFPFKNHLELNEKLQLFDFQRGAKISGTGWPIYKGLGARLEWALINYMLSVHIKNGFTQWIPPLLVRENTVFASSQLPKFENQQFKIKDDDYNLYLIPTSEVALNGLHIDEIIPEKSLPLKYVAYTPCFRREAGAAGSNERGLIRTHQFNKVEMFCFSKPEESEKIFDEMVTTAESILQGLELHYRSALLVTGDMSFSGAKTIDLEVWLPGQDRYYEVSSVSNCTDYQARRSNTRFKDKETNSNTFVHTLNGSGLATSRLMVGLLENNQNSDGSINVPKVLQPYLDGLEVLTPEG